MVPLTYDRESVRDTVEWYYDDDFYDFDRNTTHIYTALDTVMSIFEHAETGHLRLTLFCTDGCQRIEVNGHASMPAMTKYVSPIYMERLDAVGVFTVGVIMTKPPELYELDVDNTPPPTPTVRPCDDLLWSVSHIKGGSIYKGLGEDLKELILSYDCR